MIDTGSTGSFISASTAAKDSQEVCAKRNVTALAIGDTLVTTGTAQPKIEVKQKTYKVTLTIAKHLVAKDILGLDFLQQHHSVRLELGGESTRDHYMCWAQLIDVPCDTNLPSDQTLKCMVQNRSLRNRAVTNIIPSLPEYARSA